MNGFLKRTERKKRAIIEATMQMLYDKGCQQWKIEDIAKIANVSPVTIYNYFGSKKTLIHVALKQYVLKRYENYEELINDNRPFPEIIRMLMMKKNHCPIILRGDEFAEIYKEDIELKTFFEQFYQTKMIPLLLKFIQRGKKEGVIRKEISDEAILLYFDAMKMLIDQNFSELMKKPNIEKLYDQLFDMFFYGLLNDERKENE